MAQIKRFTAKKDLQLDCGHTIKASETFVVTSVYSCEDDSRWPLSIVRAAFENALSSLIKELKPFSMKVEGGEQK